jgi:hypothetical protein
MGRSFVPWIVPSGHDQTHYLVINNYGNFGPAFAETDVDRADLETIIGDLMSGQYSDPVRVVAFNVAEGWSADASAAPFAVVGAFRGHKCQRTPSKAPIPSAERKSITRLRPANSPVNRPAHTESRRQSITPLSLSREFPSERICGRQAQTINRRNAADEG